MSQRSKLRDDTPRYLELDEIDEVVAAAIEALSQSEVEMEEWLEHASCLDHTDALIALMLPRLLKLKKLDLMLVDGENGKGYLERILERAYFGEKPFDVQPAFPHLNEVFLTYYSDLGGVNPCCLELFGGLPAVRAIYGHRIGRTRDDALLATCWGNDAESSHVTHIELKDSRLDPLDIEYLLIPYKCLQTFIFEIGGNSIYDCPIETTSLRCALEPLKHSLRHLWIDLTKSAEIEIVDEGLHHFGPMSFTDFRTLTFLRISIPFISGYPEADGDLARDGWLLRNVFPSSLQSLELVHCDMLSSFLTLLIAVQELLCQKQLGREVPQLQLLVIESNTLLYAGIDSRRFLRTLLKDAENSSVRVTLVDNQKAARRVPREERLWGLGRDIEWAPAAGKLNKFAPSKIVDLQEDLSLSAKQQREIG